MGSIEAVTEHHLESWQRLRLEFYQEVGRELPDTPIVGSGLGLDGGLLAFLIKLVEAIKLVEGPAGDGATIDR
jgi:hypothetical protein